MPQVRLSRRWGQNQPNTTVDVDDEQADWLVRNNFGRSEGKRGPLNAALAPGTDGPDPVVSRTPTRMQIVKTDVKGHTGPVEGAPRQFNAGIAAEGEQPNQQRRRGRKPTADAEQARSIDQA